MAFSAQLVSGEDTIKKSKLIQGSKKIKKIGHYTVKKSLTLGKHKIKICTSQLGNDSTKDCCIKLFKKITIPRHNTHFPSFEKEFKAYSQLNHQNILKMTEYFDYQKLSAKTNQIQEYKALVIEYAQHNDLMEYLITSGGFKEHNAKLLFKQLASAVHHMHSQGFAHMDLKPENIYFDKDFTLKLADFDLSMPATQIIEAGLKYGTLGYQSPEILEEKPYIGTSGDIFALGVILFNITTGFGPFRSAMVNQPPYYFMATKQYERFWADWERKGIHVQKQLKELIQKMLSYKPSERPNMEEVMNSVWLNECDDDLTELKEELKLKYTKIQLK